MLPVVAPHEGTVSEPNHKCSLSRATTHTRPEFRFLDYMQQGFIALQGPHGCDITERFHRSWCCVTGNYNRGIASVPPRNWADRDT